MPNLHNGKWFWGYLDERGVIKVLPYTGDKIIQNTEQLPFCKGIFDVFEADSLYEAKQKVAAWLSDQQYYEKAMKQ